MNTEQAPQKNDVSKFINPLKPKRNMDPTKLSSSVSYSKFGEFECQICQSNLLTSARYNLSKLEKNILYMIIYKVRSMYVENNNNDAFQNLRFNLNKDELYYAGDKKNPKRIYDALRKLVSTTLEFGNQKTWVVVNILNFAEHDKVNDNWLVEVSSKLLPHIVELTRRFTAFDLVVALNLESIYSKRFYELCCQYRNDPRNYFYLEISDLREMLHLENKYSRLTDLRKKVLDVAQNELHQLYEDKASSVCFIYELDEKTKQGKTYTRVNFKLRSRSKENIKTENVFESQKRILDILSNFFVSDPQYILRVSQRLMESPDIAPNLAFQLNDKIFQYDGKDLPKIIRHILKEDYNII